MMNRTLMAAAIALVVGTPVAFAATGRNTDNIDPTVERCSYVDQQLSNTKFKSEAARQVAESKAESLCQQDRHKERSADGAQASKASFVILR
jgi:hypothetical protein